MRAIVTGGAGFIGSQLVDGLLEDGHAVLVYDDLSTGREENINPRASFVHASVLDRESLLDAARAHAPDTIFHLAAQIDVRRSVADPFADALINVGGTINVLETARAHKVRRFVLASTGGALYGDADTVPTPEDAAIRPESPYGQAKAAAETYSGLFHRLHGLSTVALRYSNVYGPRQDPLGEGGVVAIFCERATNGGSATVYGDGEQTRDFIYVSDVVDANLRAAANDVTGAYNVGAGVETTVLELARRLDLPYEHAPERRGEVRRSCLDPRRAADAIDWRPTTTFEEGIERTRAWVAGVSA
jgi:UDP-glucose 4-epimerase